MELFPYVDLKNQLSRKVDSAAVGAPGGVAKLGSDGRVPFAQLPPTLAELAGVVEYRENKGKPGGYASLSGTGVVPASQLPSSFPPAPHKHELPDVNGLEFWLNSLASMIGMKANAEHTHEIADVDGLQTALGDHESRITDLENDSGGGGGGPVAWDDVTDKPSSFPPAPHSHAISDVTGLQVALDGKQAAGSYAPAEHTHEIADVDGLQSALDDIEDELGDHESRITDLENDSGGGGSGPVSWDDVEGKPTTFPPAEHDASLITTGTVAADRLPHASVSAKGAVERATLAEVAAGTDPSRYVSPQGVKQETDKVRADMTTLSNALDGKADEEHTHEISDVTGLQSELDSKLDTGFSTTLNSSTDTLGTVIIESDGTSTANWPDRLRFLYKQLMGTPRLVSWFNEYGELRIIPARDNTVGFRVFVGDAPVDHMTRSKTIPVFEVSSDRTNRNNVFGVYGDGALTINGRRVTVGPTPPGSPSTGDLHILTES